MKRPYIGITDFLNFEQVEKMLGVFNTYKPPSSKRMLHIGVMMSFKTLNNIESRWTNVFPKKETIADIFRASRANAYYCLHYADYDNNTKHCDLAKAISYGGTHISALQLDMIWPDPKMIEKALGESGTNIEVILQIGRNALEMIGNSPFKVVEKLKTYNGIIQRVLVDKSMGGGVPMIPKELRPFVEAIKENFTHIDIGVAGGLGPNTIHLVGPLIKEFPDLSIDAQGKLRPSGNAKYPIDWQMAETYIIKALRL